MNAISNAPDDSFFEYAPISLWVEDFSAIKHLLDDLRESGVESLDAYLNAHPAFAGRSMRRIRVLDVNQQTLAMFKAASKEEFLANLDKVFRDKMRRHWQSELLALWDGALNWSGDGVNYTLAGDPLDISLHWRILPGYEGTWERVLVTIEDITARVQAETRLQNLFQASPISLWEEDYSAVKAYFDQLRQQGVTDLEAHLGAQPGVVQHCMRLIKVLSVNQQTLDLFAAESQEHLLANLDRVFRDEMSRHFAKELVDLWNGRLAYEREGINYSLTGEPIEIQLNFRVMPGHEEDFGWVIVAIQDITARKKAEDYLRYLGTHDVMTGLYNRAYFEDALAGLEKSRRDPISVIIADLNGLKAANDAHGHQAGDNLIRRTAEVLKAHLHSDKAALAARIGGDEFAIIMPDASAQAAQVAIENLQALVELNNKYYRQPELSLSIGAATSRAGLALEKVVNQADKDMYRRKLAYYKSSG